VDCPASSVDRPVVKKPEKPEGDWFDKIHFSVCQRENPPAGWRNAPPNPKMRRGLSSLPVMWIWDEHTRTRGIRVVQAARA
jgi:hypothetical protein